MEWIDGGVTAPSGFAAAGVSCGLKKGGALDLALLVSAVPAAAAGVFTVNQIKGHSLALTQARVHNPIRAILANSGNANACLGPAGDAAARAAAGFAAAALGCGDEEILLASTGVIGKPLDLDAIGRGVKSAAAALRPQGGGEAARAIMTTDTFPKEAAVELHLGSGTVRIGGMAKGSGMIHPNMATLLCFLTTDASLAREDLASALRAAVDRSFHAITVDGDTSPCDSVIILANGRSGTGPLRPGTGDYQEFCTGLAEVCAALARMIARDGEGATKFAAIRVTGARTPDEARRIGRSVGTSCLVKTALFGADANWGRILSAVGNSGVTIDPAGVAIRIGGIEVCRRGAWRPFSEEEAKAVLERRDVEIAIDLGLGGADATVWTCDLSYDYVKINGSYRS